VQLITSKNNNKDATRRVNSANEVQETSCCISVSFKYMLCLCMSSELNVTVIQLGIEFISVPNFFVICLGSKVRPKIDDFVRTFFSRHWPS